MSVNNPSASEAGTVDDSPSFDQSVNDIANLLDDPETDPVEGDEDQQDAETADDGDPEIDVSEDVEDDHAADDADGSDAEIKGGRFAPDSAKVTLDDGTVTTIAELKRGSLFQRDYTKKTTELAEHRKAFEARQSEVDQQAQSLHEYAEKLTAFAQKYLPQPPKPFEGSPDSDPIGYLKWTHEQRAYDQALAEFNGVEQGKSKLSEADQAKAAEATKAALVAEIETLKSKDALFADPGKAKAFLDEAVSKGAEWWGLTPEDVGGLANHKAFLILRDAVRWRKAVAKAPEAQKRVQAKPVPQAGRRADPGMRKSSERQARSERLRKSGSVDDAAAAIADLI